MAMMRILEVMLRQTLNHAVYNFLILCDVIPLYIVYLIVKSDICRFCSWYDNGISETYNFISWRPQISWGACFISHHCLNLLFLIEGVLNIGSRRGSTWPRGYTPC
jgi:hypothetical protein